MKDWREQYNYVGRFYEGKARVQKGDKWGHVDRNGKVKTPIIYDYVGHFFDGRAIVNKGDKWGHIDKNHNTTYL